MLSLYWLISIFYVLLPVAAVIWAIRARRRGTVRGAPQALAGLCFAGGSLGIAVSQSWGWMLRTRVPLEQTAVTMYWITAALCLLAGINAMLNGALRPLLRGCIARSVSHWHRRFFAVVSGLIVISKTAVMMFVGISVLSAMLLSFRPKVVQAGTPGTILAAPYETIEFPATDGTSLRGWWITPPGSGEGGRDTVLLCHGVGGDKASALPVTRELLRAGFNVLAFDFRAHGESAGHLSTFGNVERRDVLGAVHWLKAQHPHESQRILGVGIDMGAAALIAAAGDQGPDGQAIDAIAVIDPLDNPAEWLSDLADQRLTPGVGPFVSRVALPLAGAQCGVNLLNWSASNDVQQLWPRPLLVIGTGRNQLIPISAGRSLFESAQQPKFQCWMEKETPAMLIDSDTKAARLLSSFFRRARAII